MNIKDLITEVKKVSDGYAAKFDIKRDDEWYILKLQEELGELIKAYLMMAGKARKKGLSKTELREAFESEAADVFCHVLLLTAHNKIDIEKVIKEKWLTWVNLEKKL
jgi:NTP pyrophosphatase (non-canonical NTP hydrolase)